MLLDNEPILARSINRIHEALPAAEIVVVLPEEYVEFLQMVFAEKYNHVYGIDFDAETKRYTLSFFMNADANYYEIEFTGNSITAEFDEFGKDAWYLDSKWRNRSNT